MTSNELETLKNEYTAVVRKYCEVFAEKHELGEEPFDWVAEDIGGVINFGDNYYFNFDDIRPAMTPREVLAKYGFPLVSKEQAQAVRQIRTTESEKLRNYRLHGDGVRRPGVLSERWRYLADEPYMTSEKCCEILKKRPFRHYNTTARSLGMLGTMAGESRLRQTQYIRRGGCNAFDDDPKKVHSAPLSIWTGADCWEYIHRFNVPYCPIYDVSGI